MSAITNSKERFGNVMNVLKKKIGNKTKDSENES